MLALYQQAACDLGTEVRGLASAGVGDINAVARYASACLDGLGPIGSGMHSPKEQLLVDSIALRAAMTALALVSYLRVA